MEQNGRRERSDHRSYKRQGKEQLPTVHMGVAATRMERRGISTDKGNVNRQIAADNKLLKEIKARVTLLYNWTKEKAGPKVRKASWRSYFSTTSTETMSDKIKRMLRNEIQQM